MTKQEILEIICKLRELKKLNPNGYEEFKTFVNELHNKKYKKACSKI